MKREKLFHRFCGLSILGIIVLFFLGGLVRVTGSGMGCPDWPKCFGKLVPPSSEADLPENYKEIYLEKRKSKVEKLIQFLERIGMHKRAEDISNTTWLFEPHAFSASKAYTEYINRLWGAITGLFAIGTVVFGAGLIRQDFWKFGYAFLGFFFTGYNGWLGSLVVDTNLFGGMVTIHFVLAFLALFFFMLAYTRRRESIASTGAKGRKALIIAALLLAFFQLISGTLVRESVDLMNRMDYTLSESTMSLLGSKFALHRILAPVLAMVLLVIWYRDRNRRNRTSIQKYYLAVLAFVAIQIITGTLNIRWSLPSWSQLIHIVTGSLTLTGLIYIAIQEFKVKEN
ncbi:MAG: hypothetical protein GC181_02415 [Bacteroidetes bacterium]|nr:hypothetical protein [Bacteroidota bacterium]